MPSTNADEPPAFLPLIRPDLAFEEVEPDLRAVFGSGTLTRGPFLDAFEEAFAERVGARHAVMVTSATTALHLALVAAGIGPGDEVLVSDFSFPASGNVVFQCGATPVLVDCLPGRFELDVALAEEKITARTRAVLHVDPFGRPADLSAVASLATRHRLFALEDAACAVGSAFDGRRVGSWPGAAAFSFHPRKLLTTGEGGAITTDDPSLADRMRRLRSHGAVTTSTGLSFVEPGFNYRMNEIQAVIGLAQLRKLDGVLAHRRAMAALYAEALHSVPGIALAPTDARVETNHQSYVVWLNEGIERAEVIRKMHSLGIETTLGTYAMHAHPAFGRRLGHQPGDLPHSFAAQERTLTLPMFPNMARSDIDHVCESLAQAVSTSPRTLREPI